MRQTSCNGIGEVLDRLHTCGWYWGAITNTEAMRILKSKPCGTFLLRDSSHSRHYFTLSVRTSRGITSIRVLFERGRFTLDNLNTELRQSIPNFDCVLKLICYYVHLSNNQDGRKLLAKPDKNVEEDTCVVLRKPLFREVPSLKHLCRRVINTTQLLRNVPRIKLPRTIESYLLKYPYPIWRLEKRLRNWKLNILYYQSYCFGKKRFSTSVHSLRGV